MFVGLGFRLLGRYRGYRGIMEKKIENTMKGAYFGVRQGYREILEDGN